MFAIFCQGRDGMFWACNAETIERAREEAEGYRGRPDVDFVLVTPLAHFVDVDGEREGE